MCHVGITYATVIPQAILLHTVGPRPQKHIHWNQQLKKLPDAVRQLSVRLCVLAMCSSHYPAHKRQDWGLAVKGANKGALPFDCSEKAADAFRANLLSHACCPIFFLNGLLWQVWAAKHP